MAKRKISKASKRRLSIFGTISVIMIGYFIYCAFDYAINIHNLDNSEKTLINKLETLKSNEQSLKLEIQKLNDPDYLARYARENYLYSKNGEYIIKIEHKNNIISVSKIATINYKIIAGIGLVVIGTLMILFKVKNQKQLR